jgi:hypothetical protein
MRNDLDTLEALVPNAPPEEESYLKKEYSAAIISRSGSRIYDIEHLPRFPAWNVHNTFHSARNQLAGNRPIVGSSPKFRILLAAPIPHSMADAKIAWDKFQDADDGKLLTPQQIF